MDLKKIIELNCEVIDGKYQIDKKIIDQFLLLAWYDGKSEGNNECRSITSSSGEEQIDYNIKHNDSEIAAIIRINQFKTETL